MPLPSSSMTFSRIEEQGLEAWLAALRAEQSHIRQALDLNPNDADAMMHKAVLLAMRGRPEEALDCSEAAVRRMMKCPSLAAALVWGHLAGHFSRRKFPGEVPPDEVLKRCFKGLRNEHLSGTLRPTL
jgi:Tetratricopeptide repeat